MRWLDTCTSLDFRYVPIYPIPAPCSLLTYFKPHSFVIMSISSLEITPLEIRQLYRELVKPILAMKLDCGPKSLITNCETLFPSHLGNLDIDLARFLVPSNDLANFMWHIPV
jgi:hypothetical protein